MLQTREKVFERKPMYVIGLLLQTASYHYRASDT